MSLRACLRVEEEALPACAAAAAAVAEAPSCPALEDPDSAAHCPAAVEGHDATQMGADVKGLQTVAALAEGALA